MRYVVRSHVGLGDQVYMRPFVVALAQRTTEPVFMATPWPELFWDHPELRLVQYDKGLRTQRENLERSPFRDWAALPRDVETINLTYTPGLVKRGNVITALLQSLRPYCALELGDLAFRFDPPPRTKVRDPRPKGCKLPLAIFHPPTRRLEWDCPARNPDWNVWQPILRRLRQTHHVHWVAYEKEGCETIGYNEVGWMSARDTKTIRGELHWTEMAALMQLADICVCPPCNFIPLGLALGSKLFVVFGGHVPPAGLVHQVMLKYQGQWTDAVPEPFCFCVDNTHACHKSIPQAKLLAQLEKALLTQRPTDSNGTRVSATGGIQ